MDPLTNSADTILPSFITFSLNTQPTRPRSLSLCGADELPTRSSPTARNKLIQALENRTLHNIQKDAEEFPPFELALYIQAILTEPFIADRKEHLARCILKLSIACTTMNTCSRSSWKALTNLLSQCKKPDLQQLAAFLKDDPLTSLCRVDADFLSPTWNRLARSYALWECELQDILIEKTLVTWLIEQPSIAHATVALIFCAQLFNKNSAESSLEELVCDPFVLDFMLKATGQTTSTTGPFSLLKELNLCSENKNWDFMSRLPPHSLSLLESILKETSETWIDTTKPKDDTVSIVCITSRLIELAPECDVVVFSKLTGLIDDLLKRYHFTLGNLKKTLQSQLLSKTWKSTALSATPLQLGETFDSFSKFFTDIGEYRDGFCIKFFTAILRNFQEVEAQAPIEHMQNSQLIAIKAAVLELGFRLYTMMYSIKAKETLFGALLATFKEKITDSSEEFDLFLSNFDQTLSFSYLGNYYTITL